MTEGQASISSDIFARYAVDAAMEVGGVRKLAGRRGVRIETQETGVRVELHLGIEWGESIPEVGRSVQTRVREYLERMTEVVSPTVDVVIEDIGPPA
jgi:uncharacterized alkaline shock family protein YloU